MNLLRENKIDEARPHLEIAYRGDPFSAPIVNTLRLIDSFDNFVVSQHPRAKPRGSRRLDTPRTIPARCCACTRTKPPCSSRTCSTSSNRTIETYSKRYGFELKEPVIVELYPDHDDFAVRIAGLPGIGLLGVTFGYLVAMDSPTGRADADFHWGTTLWHEMAHVFTLEATNHLVPRWFSEGVSVYEEWSTGPLPGRHIPLPVLAGHQRGQVPADRRARSRLHPPDVRGAGHRVVHAGRAHLRVHRGALRARRRLARMLEGVRRRQGHARRRCRPRSRFRRAQFDENFAAYVETELGSGRRAARAVAGEAGRAAARPSRPRTGGSSSRRPREAIELFPDYVDEGSPYIAKARAHRELGETALVTETLLEYRKRGGYDPDALISLARTLGEAEPQRRRDRRVRGRADGRAAARGSASRARRSAHGGQPAARRRSSNIRRCSR